MAGIVTICLALASVGALLLITRNATRLFFADIERGRVARLRGRAPQRLLHEITDVVSRRPVSSARITVRVRDGAAMLEARGDVTDTELQRLRNVLATFPLARIRSAPYRSIG